MHRYFFAFGLFALARRSGYFPTELVETFEPVRQEEGRHILFFVNWVAWRRRNMPIWRRALFQARIVAVWVFPAWERLGLASSLGREPARNNNFTVTGAKSVGMDIGIAELIDICLAEQGRRLGSYDGRLLRPRTVPFMLGLARRVMRARGSTPASA